jgi:hypothetical protein
MNGSAHPGPLPPVNEIYDANAEYYDTITRERVAVLADLVASFASCRLDHEVLQVPGMDQVIDQLGRHRGLPGPAPGCPANDGEDGVALKDAAQPHGLVTVAHDDDVGLRAGAEAAGAAHPHVG